MRKVIRTRKTLSILPGQICKEQTVRPGFRSAEAGFRSAEARILRGRNGPEAKKIALDNFTTVFKKQSCLFLFFFFNY